MVVQGSVFYNLNNQSFKLLGEEYQFAGQVLDHQLNKLSILEHSFTYLNAPYLWGGRSSFGIDCSGFTQMVYMLAGFQLPRDAKDQAKLGETLSFIEEAEPGDLAFFDNEEGNIVHVGIIMADNYIIHASGKVRIDRLDQYGIANNELKTHSHRLRVIKKIF
jgi:cell wall-associated NlpC family hydrolase